MNCSDVLDRLDELLDGALDDGEREELDRHLELCTTCQEELGAALRLRAAAQTLPPSIEPDRDLWPEVRARITAIDTPGHRRGATLRLVAAAAVLVIGVAVTSLMLRGGAERQAAELPATPASLRPASLEGTVINGAERDLRQASETLRAALHARRNELSPATRAVVDENLQVIDEALERMRAALQQDPSNRQLATLLVATYQKQIDLLQQAATLPGRG